MSTQPITNSRRALASLQTPAALSDDELLVRLCEILRDSRRVEADLVAHIAEVDVRRLYLRETCSSMFAYCVERLHLSEPETALRILVARASRRHPALLDLLRDGSLHLSGIALLAPHLDERNCQEVLARASHRSKRQIEELVAGLAPRPDAPTLVRRLPAARAIPSDQRRRSPGVSSSVEAWAASGRQHRPDDVAAGGMESTPPASGPTPGGDAASRPGGGVESTKWRHHSTMEPLGPSRYKVQFTASAALKSKLERLQVLMRGSVRDGDLATLIEDAVTEKIARLEARRLGAAKKPRQSLAECDFRPGPRHIPVAVKRAVRERDGDRCAYVDRQGRRCSERNHLQFHHRVPHGFGGDRSVSNIAQVCRNHNLLEAEADLGRGRRHVTASAWKAAAWRAARS